MLGSYHTRSLPGIQGYEGLPSVCHHSSGSLGGRRHRTRPYRSAGRLLRRLSLQQPIVTTPRTPRSATTLIIMEEDRWQLWTAPYRTKPSISKSGTILLIRFQKCWNKQETRDRSSDDCFFICDKCLQLYRVFFPPKELLIGVFSTRVTVNQCKIGSRLTRWFLRISERNLLSTDVFARALNAERKCKLQH